MEKCTEFCSQHAKIEAILEKLTELLDEQRREFADLSARLTRQEELLAQYLKAVDGFEAKASDFFARVDALKERMDRFEGALNLIKASLFLFFSAGGASLVAMIIKALR